MSIKKEQNNLAASVKWLKFATGFTDPTAGPMFPKEEAAAPNAEKKSIPKSVKITDAKININM